MIDWELIAHEQHQKELMEQAKQDQMALDLIRQGHKGFNPTMAWLGDRMMTLGARLVALSGRENDTVNLN